MDPREIRELEYDDTIFFRTGTALVSGLVAGSIWGSVVAAWRDVPAVERNVALPALKKTLRIMEARRTCGMVSSVALQLELSWVFVLETLKLGLPQVGPLQQYQQLWMQVAKQLEPQLVASIYLIQRTAQTEIDCSPPDVRILQQLNVLHT